MVKEKKKVAPMRCSSNRHPIVGHIIRVLKKKKDILPMT